MSFMHVLFPFITSTHLLIQWPLSHPSLASSAISLFPENVNYFCQAFGWVLIIDVSQDFDADAEP